MSFRPGIHGKSGGSMLLIAERHSIGLELTVLVITLIVLFVFFIYMGTV